MPNEALAASSYTKNHNNKFQAKPQEQFRVPIDNSLNYFIPRIKFKPNALTPLDTSPIYSKRGRILIKSQHPYKYEIDSFELASWQLRVQKPINPTRLQDDLPIFVDTYHKLVNMLKELRMCREIAIDLEGHIRRSFLGLTCILQISTRAADYIIDCLELRDDLYILNEVFTDPNTVKVLHGASGDIPCLQRDLSLYIVNMFDTYVAARYLSTNNKSASLAAIVEQYCNVKLDKRMRSKYDWRVRPLNTDQMLYARQDTHYLLFIYDNLRNLLLKDKPNTYELEDVYSQSRAICKVIYEKPKLTDPIHLSKKCGNILNSHQIEILKVLVDWRDMMARESDESLDYVTPNEMLVKIAKTSPTTCEELLACCSVPYVPNYVRRYQMDLVQLIETVSKNND